MSKAIFFDRDGVINRERGDYTYKTKDFVINEGVIDTLITLSNYGYLLIIISNQGGISKNLYSKNDVEILHQYLISELEKHHIKISEIYYCPHHSINEKCLCRKPGSLLFEKAIARFNIDIQHSYMIGDSQRDIIAAEKTGIKGIKIEPNDDIREILKQIVK
ncbi:MAG: HAD family hydrolase [Bacteroidales bacterium]|jgi:D-glycero-D-manno-heptose 1,7-bisphosphate phosphatase|nr:HAD family hydrolase [Bacteroidales bacterium]